MSIVPIDLNGMLADPSHPDWGSSPPFPSWVTAFRPHQTDAAGAAYESFLSGSRVVFLDAPVGAGKSLLAEMVRRLLGNVTAVYACTTISLQDQLLGDFPYARLLKGRRNYPTLDGPPDVTCDDCTAAGVNDDCMWCDDRTGCPYVVARNTTLTARLALLNTAYFLTEANGPGKFGARNARGLVVLDEADTLESSLMSHVEVVVAPFWQRRMKIRPPQVKTAGAKSSDWLDWSLQAYDRAVAYVSSLRAPGTDVRAARHRRSAENLASKLRMLAEDLPNGGWVYDGYNRDEPTIVFKPVKVDRLAPDYLWQHGQRFLLMSGSFISTDVESDSLGLEGDYAEVNVRVDWDPARRPVHVVPVASVTYKTKKAAYPALATAVSNIIAKHPDDRILVHTVSYDLARYLYDNVARHGRKVLTYTRAADRQAALDDYKATPGAVLLAPSMDRGVDLPDDLCRVSVICKVPFPNLGDKQVSTRAHMGHRGKTWYQVQTVRSIIQMLGRGMRHEGDAVTTYVLDEQFVSNVLKRSRMLLPEYVRVALVDGPRELREELMRP